jgi:hypothetical protein
MMECFKDNCFQGRRIVLQAFPSSLSVIYLPKSPYLCHQPAGTSRTLNPTPRDESGHKLTMSILMVMERMTWKDGGKKTATCTNLLPSLSQPSRRSRQLEVLRYCFLPSVRRILLKLPKILDGTYKGVLKEVRMANRTCGMPVGSSR